jgi:hypothetical protein
MPRSLMEGGIGSRPAPGNWLSFDADAGYGGRLASTLIVDTSIMLDRAGCLHAGFSFLKAPAIVFSLCIDRNARLRS